MSDSPDMIGAAALKLANDGKLDAARTWLNWVRELIAAGGGDDPLAGPPFARLWQKEKPSATADEIRLAAAALMIDRSFAKESVPLLVALHDQAPTDEAKAAADMALLSAYSSLHDRAKALPIAERLSKAHPDSGLAFTMWVGALAAMDRTAEAEAIAKERLGRLPKDEWAMRAMFSIFAKKGDYETAAMWSRRIVDEITPTLNDYNNAAWIALFLGKDLDRAIDDARRATADESRATSGALHTLAAVYAESGKAVEARQALLKSIDARGGDDPRSEDWFVLGRIAETYGVHDVAVSAYERVEKGELTGDSTWELVQKRVAVAGVK